MTKAISGTSIQPTTTRPTTAPPQTQAPQSTGQTEATTSTNPTSNHPPIGQDSGYEVSNPNHRMAIDRAGQQPTPVAADPSLAQQANALRAGANASRPLGGGASDISGSGLNNSADSLRSSTGPIPASAWDNPANVVGHLTQTPGRGQVTNSQSRCAPSSLFGGALMNGPDAGARMLDNAATNADPGQLTTAQRDEMRGIAGRLRDRTASYEDLSRAQSLLYRTGNTEVTAMSAAYAASDSRRLSAGQRRQLDGLINHMETPGSTLSSQQRTQLESLLTRANGRRTQLVSMTDPAHPEQSHWGVRLEGAASERDRSGFNDREVSQLADVAGTNPSNAHQIDIAQERPMQHLIDQLEPGQSVTVRMHHEDPGDALDAAADHFVTFGRTPSGQPYIYNPDPSNGDHTLYTGNTNGSPNAGFDRELRRYDDRIAFESDGDIPNAVTATHVD